MKTTYCTWLNSAVSALHFSPGSERRYGNDASEPDRLAEELLKTPLWEESDAEGPMSDLASALDAQPELNPRCKSAIAEARASRCTTRRRADEGADELARLPIETAEGPPRDGSTGDERKGGIPGPECAVLYRMAAETETGLRRNELKTLRVTDLDIADIDGASVSVRATNTKNRRAAHLPLRPDLATALRSHVRERLPAARVFTLPKDFRAAVVLRADLEVADIPYEDDAGRVVDFHSLRLTFGTNLARGGVALQLAQRLLRHSTPVLTANVYTVLGRDDDRKAIEKLPDVGVAPATEALRATGTDARAVSDPDPRSPRPRRDRGGAARASRRPTHLSPPDRLGTARRPCEERARPNGGAPRTRGRRVDGPPVPRTRREQRRAGDSSPVRSGAPEPPN